MGSRKWPAPLSFLLSLYRCGGKSLHHICESRKSGMGEAHGFQGTIDGESASVANRDARAGLTLFHAAG